MDSAPPAFGDHDDDSIGVVRIESTWRQHTDSADKATSTNRIETANAKIQVIKRCDVETSTGAMLAPLVRHLDSAQAAGLERFFRARLDDTIALLRRNARSTAFDGYDPSAWDDGAEPVSCVHALKDTTGRAAIAPESVTAVVWNCTGAIVVAAYGVLDGADGLSWAARKSVLCAWSVTRRSLSAGKADSIVELDDSVACLAFHPTEPTLLAGGAFNGDVLLWDVSNDEQPLRFKSTLSDYSHLEPVTRLAWTRPLGRERHDLVSLGADGKVLVWRPDEEAHRLLHPVGGFILLAPSATSAAKAYAASGGDALGGGGSAGGGGGGIERVHGGMALSFAPEDPNSFVVGVEAGLVLKCSLGADRRKFAPLLPLDPSLKWSADAEAVMAARAGAADFMRIKLKVEKAALLAHEREITLATLYGAGLSASALFGSPRVFDYEPHAGVVYDAAHSPFCRNLFLTVSTDSAVRLYSMLQGSPLMTVTPTAGTVFCAAWSTSRPMVFAVGGANGRVYVYDLAQIAKGGRGAAAGGGAQLQPVEELEASRKAVFSVQFNPSTPELLASGDAEGLVKVWKLGARLSTPQQRERDRLDALVQRFAASVDEDENGEDEREAAPPASGARRAAEADHG